MATRHNVCVNPACGSNVTGWTGGAAPTRNAALSGFPVSTGASYTTGTYQQTPAGAATPGVTYTGSVYVRTNTFSQSGKTLYLVFTRSSGGDDFSHTTTVSLTPGTVTRVSITAVAPALATGVYLLLDGINASSSSMDYTAVLLEAASTTDTYFDGNTAGATWDGTADNSASTKTDAPAGPTVTIWNGTSEVAVTGVSVWDGATEHASTSLAVV